MSMEKCPRANMHPVDVSYTIDFDSYNQDKRCIVDSCSVSGVVDENNYSYLKQDLVRGVTEKIKVVNGVETEVIKTYKLE